MLTQDLFNVSAVAEPLQDLLDVAAPWEVLARIDRFLEGLEDEHYTTLGAVHEAAVLSGPVYVAPGAVVGPHAYIEGPAWLGAGAEVGHGAFLRGGVVLAPGAKVGHSSEVKHALLLEGAKAPHFNYIGDAVVGRNVNLGAGVKLANFRSDGGVVKAAGRDTGLRKFSAAVGDEAFIGCNAVLAPGTLVGPRCVIYSGVMLRGVVPADTIVKLRQPLEKGVLER